ncbi:MAG: sigma 54-interacting transcriptional regulator [Alkalispirochaetaceae bacterium]
MFKSEVDAQRFDTLIEINTLINSDYSDPRALLERIVESATRLTEGEASSLLLVNPKNQKLYFEIALGAKGADVQKFSLNMGEGIAGWVAEHNRSLIVNDVEDDPRHFRQSDRDTGFKTKAILAVPMRMRDEVMGVIEIINKKGDRPFDQTDLQWLEIFANQAALAIQNAQSFQRARDEISLLSDQITSEKGYHTFVGVSQVIQERLNLVSRVARTDSTVLILGESGVGKELFAEQIHLQSKRSHQPFIRVNCAALPDTLLESELFGHVRGAFTDAVSDRRGRFELADGGTIFLDEIGDLHLPLQAKMLRVLQERTFERVGSSEPVTVDVRIIAATNKDIEELVEEGSFRSDLYYRLNVLPLTIPPLRQRREDIPELANFFLRRFSHETKKQIRGFSDSAMEHLLSYSWPGNVRELENAIERAAVMSQEELIRPEDLILRTKDAMDPDRYNDMGLKESTHQFKRNFIRNALNRHGWNHTRTAQSLGIQRTYLSRLIKELDIQR